MLFASRKFLLTGDILKIHEMIERQSKKMYSYSEKNIVRLWIGKQKAFCPTREDLYGHERLSPLSKVRLLRFWKHSRYI